jgi:glycosyltransferase involved in cell wall biosynthesis
MYDLGERFLLAVGHLEERKNYSRLIDSVAELRRSGQQVDLVIVGNDAGQGPALKSQIASLGLAAHVRLLEGISDKDLADLYSLSELVVFPSRYEGFGIPILEAMAAGRPLALSDIPVFRELTEDHGAYFPPDDVGAMADLIGKLLESPERTQQVLRYQGERVDGFDFAQLATKVEQLHSAVLSKKAASS